MHEKKSTLNLKLKKVGVDGGPQNVVDVRLLIFFFKNENRI